jgi:hypothetical protein
LSLSSSYIDNSEVSLYRCSVARIADRALFDEVDCTLQHAFHIFLHMILLHMNEVPQPNLGRIAELDHESMSDSRPEIA